MKRIICLLALAAAFCYSVYAQDFVFTDASTLPLYGKIQKETYETYSRLPQNMESTVREAVWNLGRQSAGLYIRFTSDAGNFRFKWTSTFKKDLDNMTGIGVRGLSLYVFDGNEWQYLSPLRPNKKEKESTYDVSASLLVGKQCEYMLYLSLYDGVQDLQIGVPEGRTVAASTFNSPRAEKPVIIYGTSILQGASASSPGLCGTAQLSRRFDRQVINLGFSGNCKLEAPLAEYMASYKDPGMFIIDNWNGSVEVGEKGLENCIRIIRSAHPQTVILVVDRPEDPLAAFDEKSMNTFTGKRDLAEKVVRKIRKEGDRNIYHVTPEILGDGASGTCDGCHFTDESFTKWVDAISPYVKKAYRAQ